MRLGLDKFGFGLHLHCVYVWHDGVTTMCPSWCVSVGLPYVYVASRFGLGERQILSKLVICQGNNMSRVCHGCSTSRVWICGASMVHLSHL